MGHRIATAVIVCMGYACVSAVQATATTWKPPLFWRSPERLSLPLQGTVDAPQVATDAEGDAAVVWARHSANDLSSQIEVAVENYSQGFGPPALLSAGISDPRVAMSAPGIAAIIWQRDSTRHTHVVEVAIIRQHIKRTIAVKQTLASFPGITSAANVTFDGHGEATAVFASGHPGRSPTITYAMRPLRHTWTRPQSLSVTSSPEISEPVVAVDRRQETLLAWLASERQRRWVQALVLDAHDQPGGAVQTLSSPGAHASELRLANDAAGNAVLAWHQDTGAAGTIEAATRIAGARFTAATTVSGEQSAREPAAAIGAGGKAVVLFTTTRGKSDTTVQSVTHETNSQWSKPSQLSPPGQPASQPQLAAEHRGGMLALWTAGSPLATTIESSTRNPLGTWQNPVEISPAGTKPAIAFNPYTDAATAAWIDTNDTRGTTIEATRYEFDASLLPSAPG